MAQGDVTQSIELIIPTTLYFLSSNKYIGIMDKDPTIIPGILAQYKYSKKELLLLRDCKTLIKYVRKYDLVYDVSPVVSILLAPTR